MDQFNDSSKDFFHMNTPSIIKALKYSAVGPIIIAAFCNTLPVIYIFREVFLLIFCVGVVFVMVL